jgi:group I intron endonuclease
MKTYYTIYKVTNKISGKFYIGAHKTIDLDDAYMGSGKYLKHSIEKHGLDNFEKKILHVFGTSEEMFAKEAEIVNEEFIAEENTYNLKVGGFGGWDYANSKQDSEWKSYISNKSQRFTGKTFSEAAKQKLSESKVGERNPRYGKPGTMLGKTHSDEAKNKIGLANKITQAGSKNSQYGKRFKWMTDKIINKKVSQEDVAYYLNMGFVFGRNKSSTKSTT